jgi:hypothetical protein
MTETPREEPAAVPEEPATAPVAPAAQPAQRNYYLQNRPLQIGLAAAAGLIIGGIGGLGIGFAAGHHFDGGGRHHQHGYYQDGPRRDRMPMKPPMQPPRKINPQKPGQPLPTNPAPNPSPTA